MALSKLGENSLNTIVRWVGLRKGGFGACLMRESGVKAVESSLPAHICMVTQGTPQGWGSFVKDGGVTRPISRPGWCCVTDVITAEARKGLKEIALNSQALLWNRFRSMWSKLVEAYMSRSTTTPPVEAARSGGQTREGRERKEEGRRQEGPGPRKGGVKGCGRG